MSFEYEKTDFFFCEFVVYSEKSSIKVHVWSVWSNTLDKVNHVLVSVCLMYFYCLNMHILRSLPFIVYFSYHTYYL